jgi:ribosomal protein S18 acetylase RimI-like enzyme
MEKDQLIRNKSSLNFQDIVQLKILAKQYLLEQNQLTRSELQQVNSLGFWQKVIVSDDYQLTYCQSQDNQQITAYLLASIDRSSEKIVIKQFYVAPELRNQGIAQQLLNDLLLKEKQFSIYQAIVDSNNKMIIKLFERNHFKKEQIDSRNSLLSLSQ